MITLHEQQALLLYDQTVINNDCSTQLISLMKDNLQNFLTTYSYKVISEEIHYQRIFLALRSILNMDSLEENVSDTIFMLDEECKQSRERTINGVMTIIAIWGLFSAVGDLLTIMDLAINQKVFDNIATYIAMAIMSGVLVVAVAAYFVYKYVERKR